jgi:hypothetical protein
MTNFDKWKTNLSECFQVDDFFSKEEISWMIDFMWREHSSTTIKESGTMLFKIKNKHTIIADKFSDRFKRLINKDFSKKHYGGNFYLTLHPYALHADSMSEEESSIFDHKLIPLKHFVIPLFVTPSKNEDLHSGLICFRERVLNYGTIFCQGFKKDSVKGYWKDVYSHDDIEFYDLEKGSRKYNKENNWQDQKIYDEYLSFLPKENLTDLHIEKILPWKIGSIMVIDPTQIHCSADHRKNNTKTKCGLAFTLYEEIE